MATIIQQRLFDLAADIATSPPEDLAFTHSVLAQTSLPTARPPEVCFAGSAAKAELRFLSLRARLWTLKHSSLLNYHYRMVLRRVFF